MNAKIATVLLVLLVSTRSLVAFIDRDGDGMSDVWQDHYSIPGGTGDRDFDGDGFSNLLESKFGTDPNDPASPKQVTQIVDAGLDPAQFTSIRSSMDVGKGKSATLEYSTNLREWSDGGVIANSLSESDPWPNNFLQVNLSSSNQSAFVRWRLNADIDEDGDGLNLYEEHLLGLNDSNPDVDGDGIKDGYEYQFGFDPEDPIIPSEQQKNQDDDFDGLNLAEEAIRNTNPLKSDTDDDGLLDGSELFWYFAGEVVESEDNYHVSVPGSELYCHDEPCIYVCYTGWGRIGNFTEGETFYEKLGCGSTPEKLAGSLDYLWPKRLPLVGDTIVQPPYSVSIIEFFDPGRIESGEGLAFDVSSRLDASNYLIEIEPNPLELYFGTNFIASKRIFFPALSQETTGTIRAVTIKKTDTYPRPFDSPWVFDDVISVSLPVPDGEGIQISGADPFDQPPTSSTNELFRKRMVFVSEAGVRDEEGIRIPQVNSTKWGATTVIVKNNEPLILSASHNMPLFPWDLSSFVRWRVDGGEVESTLLDEEVCELFVNGDDVSGTITLEFLGQTLWEWNLNKISLYRDRNDNDQWTEELDDWPAITGSNPSPRQARHSLAKVDNLNVEIVGFENLTEVALQVKSESDQQGIEIILTKVGDTWENIGSNKLRLGNDTGDYGNHKKIKVVDEELLEFYLKNEGVEKGKIIDILIDKSEFSSAGIDVFYQSATGDRQTLRNSALGVMKMFDSGDGSFANDLSQSGQLQEFQDFIKNGGSSTQYLQGGDILTISSHGNKSGKLFDDVGATIFDPAIDSQQWGGELEWLILAACSTLNDGQSSGAADTDISTGGRANWERILGDGHGVLGAYLPLSSDLRVPLENFWDLVNDEQIGPILSIPQAYSAAMSAAGQPWAMVYSTSNEGDQIRKMNRRENSGTSFTYLTAVTGFNFGCREGYEKAKVVSDVDVRILFDPSEINWRNKKIWSIVHSKKNLTRNDFVFSKKGAIERTLKSGRYIHINEISLEKECRLTLEEARIKVDNELDRILDGFKITIDLSKSAIQKREDTRDNGIVEKSSTGYFFEFEQSLDGVPVDENTVTAVLQGNNIGGISVRLGIPKPDVGSLSRKPIDWRRAVKTAIKGIKNFEEKRNKLFLTPPKLCYTNMGDGKYVPSWKIAFLEKNEKSKGLGVTFYINAIENHVLEKD